MFYYKENKNSKVLWIKDDGSIGEFKFTFDKKKVYYLFRDYPNNMTKEEVKIFSKENPYWKKFFNVKI